MRTRATAAAGSAPDECPPEFTEEVERILAAAVVVMDRVAPDPPRMIDIVKEAGASSRTFYRYFNGKDDLILAVTRRGTGLVRSYLEHQMAKEDDPAAKVARWIQGALAHLGAERPAGAGRAVTVRSAIGAGGRPSDEGVARSLRDLLLDPVAELGSADPARDADAIFATVFGTVHRHQARGTRPGPDDVAHLSGFCLGALRGDGGLEQAGCPE